MYALEGKTAHVKTFGRGGPTVALGQIRDWVRVKRGDLERDPYNSSLLFKLSHTRRSELRLLQQVVL